MFDPTVEEVESGSDAPRYSGSDASFFPSLLRVSYKLVIIMSVNSCVHFYSKSGYSRWKAGDSAAVEYELQ